MPIQLNNSIKKITAHLIFFFKEKVEFALLFLFLISFAAAGIIFYFYAIRSSNQLPPTNEIKIDKATYQQVLNRLNARETNIQQGIEKNYPDVFK